MQLHIIKSMKGYKVRQAVLQRHLSNKCIVIIALTLRIPIKEACYKKYRHQYTKHQVPQTAINVRCMKISRRYSHLKIRLRLQEQPAATVKFSYPSLKRTNNLLRKIASRQSINNINDSIGSRFKTQHVINMS